MSTDKRALLAPRPEPERIASLINRINMGDIKLPTFQRPQVWRINQVIDLLDSIRNGYPIGSLLFWLTYTKLSSERDIGGFQLPDTTEKYPRNYVLDGQQRLTALYAVLSRNPRYLHRRFQVVYDLETCKFVDLSDDLPHTHLPLHVLYDTKRYLDFQEQLKKRGKADLIDEAKVLWETFQNYVVPVVTVQEAPIEVVGTIFERINSRGTRLTLFDLMVAATWQSEEGEEFNLRASVDSVREHLEEKDFGGIEEVSILRALSVITNKSAKKDAILGLRELSPEKLKVNLEKTRQSLARAVDFFVTDVYVKSSDFLPYERQLILLTYVMSMKSTLQAREINNLRRWFWKTSFAERYRRGGEGLFDEDLQEALKAISKPSLLKRFGSAPSKDFFINSQFRKGTAASQAFAALLASQSPRNMTNGAYIDVGSSLSQYNRKEFHHLFPQAFLKNLSVDKSLINALANICLLSSSENKIISDKKPSVYVAKLQDDLGDEFIPVMESNLISSECVDKMLST